MTQQITDSIHLRSQGNSSRRPSARERSEPALEGTSAVTWRGAFWTGPVASAARRSRIGANDGASAERLVRAAGGATGRYSDSPLHAARSSASWMVSRGISENVLKVWLARGRNGPVPLRSTALALLR